MKLDKDAYFVGWNTPEEMLKDFYKSEDGLENATVLFAVYETPPYKGYALVIYRQNSKLYEVEGSHCSCRGLEGQWAPIEVNWKYLKTRKLGYYSGGFSKVFFEMVSRH